VWEEILFFIISVIVFVINIIIIIIIIIVVTITTIIIVLYFLSTNEIQSMTTLFVQKEFVTTFTFKKESVFIV
jgi:hypothetical protein